MQAVTDLRVWLIVHRSLGSSSIHRSLRFLGCGTLVPLVGVAARAERGNLQQKMGRRVPNLLVPAQAGLLLLRAGGCVRLGRFPTNGQGIFLSTEANLGE
jgi:hypothetical protein